MKPTSTSFIRPFLKWFSVNTLLLMFCGQRQYQLILHPRPPPCEVLAISSEHIGSQKNLLAAPRSFNPSKYCFRHPTYKMLLSSQDKVISLFCNFFYLLWSDDHISQFTVQPVQIIRLFPCPICLRAFAITWRENLKINKTRSSKDE